MSSFLDFLPLVGDAINFSSGIASNAMNRRTMREANAFNAAEAEKNRQFQSQEAQIARDWQEQQYNLYSSPSAMVRQYNEAGLNPALMYGQNLQGSTGSSPSPSGSAASGVALPANVASLGNFVQNFMGLKRLKSEINNIDADTETKQSQARLNDSVIRLNSTQVSKLNQDINESIARTDSERTKNALMALQQVTEKLRQSSMSLEQYILTFKADYIKRFNRLPDQPALNVLLDYIKPYLDTGKEFIDDTGAWTNKMYKFVKNLLFD